MARRHTRFVRPPARTKMWIGSGVGSTTLVGNAVQLISLLSAGALLLRPFTILRTRMDLHLASDQSAVSERPIVSYGEIVVTDTASAIGATAILDPSGISGNPEADWYVWQAMVVELNFLSSIAFQTPAGVRYTIDSKAMRKVGPDDDAVSMMSLDGADGAQLVTNGR